MNDKEILEALKSAECEDGFECIFGMYGMNKEKCYGCFARFPNGKPDEADQGCVAHQAAKLIERLMEVNHAASNEEIERKRNGDS